MTTKIMAPDIPNSDAAAELRTRAEATCDRYGVQRREQCVNAFLRLAESFRWRTMPPPEIEEGTLEQLKRLRDAASRLSKALRSLDEESAVLLPEFLRKDLPTHKLFCESLHSVSRQLSAPGASREHEAKELIAKQFIVTCPAIHNSDQVEQGVRVPLGEQQERTIRLSPRRHLCCRRHEDRC